MVKKSYAKINLALNVVKRMENGYHQLDMIMARINLYDKITIKKQVQNEITISSNNKLVPLNKKNIIYQVAAKFKKKYQIQDGFKIYLEKHIPTQAGLGGGSSNGAITLEILTQLYQVELSLEEKIDFVKEIGADIPFFLLHDFARVQGIGENLTPIKTNLKDVQVVIVKPKVGISTEQAYQELDLQHCPHPPIEELIMELTSGNYREFTQKIENSLEYSAFKIIPEIASLKAKLQQIEGVDAVLLSGSGSALFALTTSKQVAQKIQTQYLNPDCFVYLTRFVD